MNKLSLIDLLVDLLDVLHEYACEGLPPKLGVPSPKYRTVCSRGLRGKVEERGRGDIRNIVDDERRRKFPQPPGARRVTSGTGAIPLSTLHSDVQSIASSRLRELGPVALATNGTLFGIRNTNQAGACAASQRHLMHNAG